MKSSWVRGGVLLAAVAAAVWAVVSKWDEVTDAVRQIPWWVLLAGLAASFVYVVCTMISWRAIITIASPIPNKVASRIFYSSQVAKYLPGGVWNFVAAAEVGRDYAISRRRSVTSLVVSVLISIVTGMMLAVVALILGPKEVWQTYWWVSIVIPLGVIFLVPPVLNRCVNLALKLMRRDPLEAPLTWSATARSALWAALAWIIVGLQLYGMLVALGMDATPATLFRAVGGYALGWTAGFLIVFVPAGVGVREVALGAVLAGLVPTGALVVVILASRIMTTIADVVLGLIASLGMRGDKNRVDPAASDGAADVASSDEAVDSAQAAAVADSALS